MVGMLGEIALQERDGCVVVADPGPDECLVPDQLTVAIDVAPCPRANEHAAGAVEQAELSEYRGRDDFTFAACVFATERGGEALEVADSRPRLPGVGLDRLGAHQPETAAREVGIGGKAA